MDHGLDESNLSTFGAFEGYVDAIGVDLGGEWRAPSSVEQQAGSTRRLGAILQCISDAGASIMHASSSAPIDSRPVPHSLESAGLRHFPSQGTGPPCLPEGKSRGMSKDHASIGIDSGFNDSEFGASGTAMQQHHGSSEVKREGGAESESVL